MNPLPIANDQTPVALCEDASGSGTTAGVDLTANEAAINGGAVTYDWFSAVPPASPVATPTSVTVSNGDVFYVLVTDNITGCLDTAQVTYTVNPLPIITAPDATICKDDPITISGTAPGAIGYVWVALDGGLINSGGTTATPEVQTGQPGAGTDIVSSYEVTITDGNGCANKDTVEVTFEAVCGPTIVAIGDTICQGGLAQLNTNISNTTGTVIYSWTPTTGLSDPSAANPNVTGLTTTTTYTVIINDDLGADTSTVDVVVNLLPTANDQIPAALCEDLQGSGVASEENLTDNHSGINSGINIAFSWLSDPALTTNVPTPTNVTINNGQVFYVLVIDNITGCVDTAEVTYTVNPLPIITAPDAIVCKDLPTTINANATPAGGSYSWVSLDGGLINSGVTTATPEVQTNEPGALVDIIKRYEVTVNGPNGCINKDTVEVTFEINCGPRVTLIGSRICAGETGTLTATSSAGDGNYTYEYFNGPIGGSVWNTGAGTPDVQNDTPTTTTTYTVIVTDGNGDKDTTTADIIVNPLPVLVNQTETFCEDTQGAGTASGKNLTIHEPAINGIPGMTYSWFSDPTLSTSVPDPTNVTVSNGQIFYVLVTNTATGCVDTATVTYTVNPLPVPAAGIDTAICITQTVPLAVTGGSPGATYLWDSSIDLDDPSSATPMFTGNTAGSFTKTVTITDVNGCINSDDVVITVNDLPVVDAGPNQAICEGGQVTLSGTGATSYVWDNGITDGVAFIPPANNPPSTVTNYTVTGTDGNGCSNNDVVTVTVNALPTPNAGSDQTICLNTSTTITAISSGTGPFNFSWDNGLPNGAGPHTVSPSLGTSDYIVTVTDPNGCIASDTVSITVNPTPTVGANDDTTICIGGLATLNASGAVSYSWKDLSTGVVISNGQNVVVQPTNTTCYEVTGTDAAGCSNTDVVCVNVEQKPIPGFLASPVCDGQPTTFSNTTTGAVSYLWTFGDGSTSNVPSPQHVYNGEGSYTVKLLTISAAGCLDSITQTVDVHYQPTAMFIGDKLNSCPPLTTNFTNQSDSINSNFTYLWDFGDGSISRDTMPSHVYTNTGVYTVSLTVTTPQGCKATYTRPDYIEVYPVPIADFTADPNITDVYNPLISFTDLTIGADAWNWNFGDSATAMEQHPVHTYRDTGTFNIWLYTENIYGCKDSISKKILIRDVYTFFAPNSFTPDGDGVNDVFLPQGHAIDYDQYTLYIFDRWGELIYETDDYFKGWDGTINGIAVQIDTYVWKVNLRDIYGVGHDYIGRVSIVK